MKRAEFTLIPMGNTFRYRIRGKVFCTGSKNILPNTRVQHFIQTWVYFFKTKNEYDRFLKKNRTIKKVVDITKIHPYCNCDIII